MINTVTHPIIKLPAKPKKDTITIDDIPSNGYFLYQNALWRKSDFLRGGCNAIVQSSGSEAIFNEHHNDLVPVSEVVITVKL